MSSTIAQITGLTQGNVTAESAFPSTSGGSTRYVLTLPQLTTGPISAPTSSSTAALTPSYLDGRLFRVKATFKANCGGALNFTGKIYWNVGTNTNLTTFTNDVLLVSSGAVAGASKNISVGLSAVCLWDSASQQLSAYQELGFNNIPTTPAVINSGAQTITATNPVATAKVNSGALQFFATALFSSSNAANAVTLVQLSVDEF